VIQESVSLKYEPASEPLHISVKWFPDPRKGVAPGEMIHDGKGFAGNTSEQVEAHG